jgi:3-hydroxyacyl-CoA dehydrogenase
VLRRAIVQIKDEPGFLGNRIGFQMMNEVMQYAEKYKDRGGIDYMDAILGAFSGRAMPPIVTVNFVGLDVHKAIVDNLYAKTNDYARETFVLPRYAQDQIDKGELGVKSGAGLYRTLKNDDGSKSRQVYDIASKSFRDIKKYDFPFVKKMIAALGISDYKGAFDVLVNDGSDEAKTCLEFLLKYVLYSLATADAVAEKPGDADICMVTGFNWAPPIGIITALGGADRVKELMNIHLPADWLKKVDVNKLICKDLKSEYDYRRYFRSGK